jgi:hypothetical protein
MTATLLLALAISITAPAAPAPAHVVNSFTFTVHAPLAQTAPLFGAIGERPWSGKHWNPTFIYPQPEKDIPGALFTVPHGPHISTWVNTVFDLAAGRMQYVVFIPDALVTIIDVHLTALDPSTTQVDVTYTRTALDPAVNDDVEAMGADDKQSGPHWSSAIAAYLAAKK